MQKALGSIALTVFLFFVFLFFYWGPLFLEPTVFSVSEPRVRILLDQATASQAVRSDFVFFFFSNLFFCLVCYMCLCWMGRLLAQAFGISPIVALMASLCLGWLLLVSGNSWIFPESNYSLVLSVIDSALLGKVVLAVFVGLFVLAVTRRVGYKCLTWFAGAGLALVATVGLWFVGGAKKVELPFGKSVVIVGVDSLSKTNFDRANLEMPALHELFKASRTYTRAYTPLGRTYPAWISILSGHTPQETGAIFNLRSLEAVATYELLSSKLQRDGYRTVFAIDERRFNNMGVGFGFDRVVGPKAGVLDFVLQVFADTPLSNLALQFGLAKWIYPYSYINTASYVNYSDEGFVKSVLSAVDGGGKVFLAVHFESAHFPYKTRHSEIKVKSDNPFWSRHAEALSAVDKQVSMLMSGLKNKGVLEDALVILLSDHGEGLGDVEGTLSINGQAQDIVGYGHGVNLLSDAQNRVVLGTLVFRHGKVVSEPSEVGEQVSLTDIRAGVERYLQGNDPVLSPRSSCMIVETGIRFAAAASYKTLNEAKLAEQSASFYEVTGNGLLQLRESRLAELVRGKDVGLRCLDRLTYYSVEHQGYLAFDLNSKGLPVQQVDPLDQDIRMVEAYRRGYKEKYSDGL